MLHSFYNVQVRGVSHKIMYIFLQCTHGPYTPESCKLVVKKADVFIVMSLLLLQALCCHAQTFFKRKKREEIAEVNKTVTPKVTFMKQKFLTTRGK